MRTKIALLTVIALLATTSCQSSCRCSRRGVGPAPVPIKTQTTVSVGNDTEADTTVYLAFGANSVVLPASTGWSFCAPTSSLTCGFKLAAHQAQELPLAGQYLNVTIAFDAGVGCGSTKAELNVNNPAWYDTLDVSLVDGFSNKIAITSGSTKIGPPVGKNGNEKVFGVFPYGCDVCVARQAPPCGIPAGGSGCKSGTQYKPDVACQYQGPTMGGGSIVRVALVP
jgi:hypothetical protein